MIIRSLLIFFFIISCSLLKPEEDTSPQTKKIIPLKCQVTDHLNLASDNDQLNYDFKKYATLRTDYSFIDNAAAWLLVQMNNRPDLVSPNSAIQFFIRHGKEITYYSFSPQANNSLSYLQAIEFLLKNYKSKKTLSTIAQDIEKSFPTSFSISKSLATQLRQYQHKFIKNPYFKSAFIKGAQTIHHRDNIPTLPFQKIIKSYVKNKEKLQYENKLLTISNDAHKIIRCNRALRPYNIAKKAINYYPVAIYDNSGNALVAAITQNIETFNNWNKTFLFHGEGASPNAIFCFQFNKKKKQTILSFSVNSRSPEQIMETFLQNIEKSNDITTSIAKARILALSNPTRLIYEYNRGDEFQYQKLLRKNISIYGLDAIGLIWTYTFNVKNLGLIQDPRTPSSQSCMKQER